MTLKHGKNTHTQLQTLRGLIGFYVLASPAVIKAVKTDCVIDEVSIADRNSES